MLRLQTGHIALLKILWRGIIILLSACLLLSCQKEVQMEDFGAWVVIDAPGGASTKAPEDDAERISSIVIYAFSGDNLVGYVSETGLSGRTKFPIRLSQGGVIDFYVIANHDVSDADLGYKFQITDENDQIEDTFGRDVSRSSLEACKVVQRLNDAVTSGVVPMSNIVTNSTTQENRRFTLEPDGTWQTINISLTRAVSLVDVRFAAKGPGGNWDSYFTVESITLTMPKADCNLFVESYGTAFSTTKKWTIYDSGYDSGKKVSSYDNPERDNYEHFASAYIFPNEVGGNGAGEWTGTDDSALTKLDINYTYHYYNYYNYYKEGRNKTIYLPAVDRNTKIYVWCLLNDDTDRSFTYTVLDWDEELEIDVPAFE